MSKQSQSPHDKWSRYASKHPNPLPFRVWMQFREWGQQGGRLSDNDKVAAGKAGAAAVRKKLTEAAR